MKPKYTQKRPDFKPLNSFQKLSKAQKYLIGTFVLVLVGVGVYFWYRADSSSNQSGDSSSSQGASTAIDINAVVLPASKIQKVSNRDYPSILATHKTQPSIGFNLALNRNESNAVYGFDQKAKVMKKLYNYLGLPYRATNTVTKISNNFILQNFELDSESNQSFTQISWTYFDLQKNSNQKDYLGQIPLAYTTSGSGDQSKALAENVIWYGFTNQSPTKANEANEMLPTKDSDYGKPEYVDKAVYIYTKSLKNDVGTYLKDLKNNLEFKISDQYCGFITFSKTDFWCLNDQSRLINLTTNAEIGQYSKIVVTDSGKMYAVRNVDDLYSSVDEITFDDSGNPTTKSNIYQTKQGENISYIAYTNGQELLIQINRSQSPQFMEAIQMGENIKGLYTLQLQAKGDGFDTIPRPEFDQFTVIF